jgi:hypothetical protein
VAQPRDVPRASVCPRDAAERGGCAAQQRRREARWWLRFVRPEPMRCADPSITAIGERRCGGMAEVVI